MALLKPSEAFECIAVVREHRLRRRCSERERRRSIIWEEHTQSSRQMPGMVYQSIRLGTRNKYRRAHRRSTVHPPSVVGLFGVDVSSWCGMSTSTSWRTSQSYITRRRRNWRVHRVSRLLNRDIHTDLAWNSIHGASGAQLGPHRIPPPRPRG